MTLKLELLPGTFAVSRLGAEAPLPPWAWDGPLSSVSRTPDELSIVCPESQVPEGVPSEKGWRCLKIQGPLPFSLTGVLASLISPLAQAEISLFAFSTYDTDYVMVKEETLSQALEALTRAGHKIVCH